MLIRKFLKKLITAPINYTVRLNHGEIGTDAIKHVGLESNRDGENVHRIPVKAPTKKRELVILINVPIGVIGLLVTVRNLVARERKQFHDIVIIETV